MFSLLLVWVTVARGNLDECRSYSIESNFTTIGAAAESTNSFQFDGKMTSFFHDALMCRERLWNTTNTKLGSIATYFYDRAKNFICRSESKDRCIAEPALLKDEEVQNAVSDLVGYSTFYSKEEKREFLILNLNPSDFRVRAKENNGKDLKLFNAKVDRCSKFVTPATIPMRELKIDLSDEHILGFVAHEHLHLFQRNWKKRRPDSEKEKVELKSSKSDVFFLKERIAFHLMSYIRASEQGRPELAKTEMSAAKAYYLNFKKKYPQNLINLDNKDEGTAVFVEMRARALSKLGCQAPEVEIRKETNRSLEEFISFQTSSLESPYVLSALASQILEMNHIKKWRQQIEDSEETPLDLLLSDKSIDPVLPRSAQDSRKLVNCLL